MGAGCGSWLRSPCSRRSSPRRSPRPVAPSAAGSATAAGETAEPALARLPSGGRLLVLSSSGSGSPSPTGRSACWGTTTTRPSPRTALFVVATEGRRLVALEPDGDVLDRDGPTPVADAAGRRAPATMSPTARGRPCGSSAATAKATGSWPRTSPGAAGVAARRPHGARLRLHGRPRPGRRPRRQAALGRRSRRAPEQLVWSDDAGLLLVVTSGRRHPVYAAGGRSTGRTLETPEGQDVLDAAFAPGTRDIAFTAFDADERRELDRPRRRAAPAGRRTARRPRLLRTDAGSSAAGPKPTSSCLSAFRA